MFRSLSSAIVVAALLLTLGSTEGAASPITSALYFNLPADVTINFDTLPGVAGTPASGTALGLQYAGLQFRSEDNAGALQTTDAADASGRFGDPFRILSAVGGGGVPHSASRYAAGDVFTGLNASDMRIDFTSGTVDAFGFWVIDNDFSDARISAYGVTGLLLESLIVPQVGEGGSRYRGIAQAGISYVIIDGREGRALDSTFLDDLSYRPSTPPIPEPATVTMFGLGLLPFGGYVAGRIRRRR